MGRINLVVSIERIAQKEYSVYSRIKCKSTLRRPFDNHSRLFDQRDWLVHVPCIIPGWIPLISSLDYACNSLLPHSLTHLGFLTERGHYAQGR